MCVCSPSQHSMSLRLSSDCSTSGQLAIKSRSTEELLGPWSVCFHLEPSVELVELNYIVLIIGTMFLKAAPCLG